MVIECSSHPLKTLEKLNQQRLTSAFTDVTVIVAGHHFSVHKSLLAAYSSIFASVLQDASLSQATPNINLDGVEPEYFSVIIDFIYTSKLRVTPINIDQLHATALFLQMQEVIDLCQKFKKDCKEALKKAQLNEKSNIDASPTTVVEVTEPEPQDKDAVAQCLLQAKQVKSMMVEVFGSNELSKEETEEGKNLRGPKEILTDEQVDEVKKVKRRGRKPQTRVTCEVCNKVMTRSKYETHKRVHTGEKPFQCQQCGKTFASIYNQKIHERIHTGERPYHCEICNKTFSDPSTTRKHRLWHAGVKNKRCGICGKHFASLTQVREHMRSHTKEKPYTCTECGKSYGYRCDLKRHMREHTGNMIGPCNECGKYFNHRGNFLSHLKTHKPKKIEDPPTQLKLQESGIVTPDGRIILKAKLWGSSDPMTSTMIMVPAHSDDDHCSDGVSIEDGHQGNNDVTMLMGPAQDGDCQSSNEVIIENVESEDHENGVVKVQEITQTDGEIEVTINNRKFYVKGSTLARMKDKTILDEGQFIVKEDDITAATATVTTAAQSRLFEQQDSPLGRDQVLMFVQHTEDLDIDSSSLPDGSKNAESSPANDLIISSDHVKSFGIVSQDME